MAKVLKYVLGMDNKNRFESFYSAGAPAQDFVRYSAVDNLDGHVTDEEFDVDFFDPVGIVTRKTPNEDVCSAT